MFTRLRRMARRVGKWFKRLRRPGPALISETPQNPASSVDTPQNPASRVETPQIDGSTTSTVANDHRDEYSPATKGDILEVCSEVLSKRLQPQYDRFTEKFEALVQQNQDDINGLVASVADFFTIKEENASLRGENAKLEEQVLEEKRLHQKLKEKYSADTKVLNARLQQQREKVVQYERELQTMKNTVASLKEDKQKLTDNLKKMTQAPCHRPQCKQKIEQLQRDLNKLKPMEVMYHQHDGQNEQLSRDYDELMKASRGDSVLHLLEKQFNDPFDAKQVLSSLFVGAYDHSKEYLFQCLHEQLDQLYVVQEDEAKHMELENLSSAFGLLLHHTGARTQLKPPAVQYVRKQLKEILPTLEPYSRAKRNLAEVELPLDKVAEVAWKFVTVPNPVIVMELEHYYGEEFQTRQYGKWKDGCEDYTLVYGRPLVYRSYHGIVMHTALVGQKTK